MYDSIEDEETSTLLSVANNESSKSKTASKSGVMVNRVLVILVLAGLVAVSIWLQSFQTQLNEQLSTDEEKIKELEDIVQAQAKVIARFNDSVTNSDVIGQLETMENTWDQERAELFDQLDQTKVEVNEQLNSTMIELNRTVEAAQAEIQDQVDTVTKNFDQYVVQTEHRFNIENDFMRYQIAGTITILSCLISMWHMGSHSRKMNQPAIQRKILAILWMVPIYAVTSCLSLIFPSIGEYLGIIKDFYESYIIYQFLSFCIAAIGGGDREKTIDILTQHVEHLTPPFRLFFCCSKETYENDRVLAAAILLECQTFAMQFVFFRPVTAITMFVLKKYDYYGPYADDALDWKSIQFWMVIIQNVSTFFAFAGLMKFYHAVDKELQWCRPFAKFLCIKGVVFMTFWQGTALQILAQTTNAGADDETWSQQIQNFLICLEMLGFSIAHFYCFPTDEWQPGYKVNYRKAKFGETMALNDFFTDLKTIMTEGKKKKKKKRSKEPSESTIPEEDDDESETVADSVSAMGNSMDDEDPQDAFVEALTNGINSYEDDQNDTSIVPQDNLDGAKHRFASMLGEMLFSPEDSTQGSLKTGPISRRNSDEEVGTVDQEDVKETTGILTGEAEAGTLDEEDVKETTGLLTGEAGASLTLNLRPSIFTTIAEQQSASADSDDVPTEMNEEGILDGQEESQGDEEGILDRQEGSQGEPTA